MRCECHVDVNRGGLAENGRRGYTGSVRKFNYGDSIPLEAERAVKTVGRRECAPWIQGGSIRQQGGMRAHAIASLLLRAFEGRAAGGRIAFISFPRALCESFPIATRSLGSRWKCELRWRNAFVGRKLAQVRLRRNGWLARLIFLPLRQILAASSSVFKLPSIGRHVAGMRIPSRQIRVFYTCYHKRFYFSCSFFLLPRPRPRTWLRLVLDFGLRIWRLLVCLNLEFFQKAERTNVGEGENSKVQGGKKEEA